MEEIIQILFRRLKLGTIICPPEPVAGGLLHKLMKVESRRLGCLIGVWI